MDVWLEGASVQGQELRYVLHSFWLSNRPEGGVCRSNRHGRGRQSFSSADACSAGTNVASDLQNV